MESFCKEWDMDKGRVKILLNRNIYEDIKPSGVDLRNCLNNSNMKLGEWSSMREVVKNSFDGIIEDIRE